MVEDPVAFLEARLALYQDRIQSADDKIGPIMAIDTAMLGSLAAFTPQPDALTVLTGFLGILASLLLVLSLFFLVWANYPRLGKTSQSVVFFGGVAERTAPNYEDMISALSREDYISDLSRQCYRIATISEAKFNYLRVATLLMFLSVVPWALALYMMYPQE